MTKKEMETTKERILEAAAKCPQAKETLKTLFPECFVEDKSVYLNKIPIANFLWVRGDGEYKGKAFFLSDILYNWEIKVDSSGALCLIPTRK